MKKGHFRFFTHSPSHVPTGTLRGLSRSRTRNCLLSEGDSFALEQPIRRGFSLVELMVTLVISSLVVGGLYSFLIRQRRTMTTQRLKANLESASQIAFFVIGRDIRRAGSNPKGWGAYDPGEAIAFEVATQNKIIVRADLDGDGDVTDGTDERVTYEFKDSADDSDTDKDYVERQSGNQLVIENVKNFEFCYYLTGGFWDCNPADPSLIKKVRITLKTGTGRVNPDTGIEDTKEIQMVVRPRNFDT